MNRERFVHLVEREAKRVAFEMARFRQANAFENMQGHVSSEAYTRKGPDLDANEIGPLPGKGKQRNPTSGPLGFSPFYYYPFLFSSAFPALSLETFRTLSLANRILLEAILLLDKHLDSSHAWTPENLCLVDACYHRAMDMLVPLFPPDHAFWEQTETYFLEYARSVLREQTHHRYRLSRYDDREFIEISTGKVSLLKTTVLAMSLLTDTQDLFIPLSESQRWFLVGFQAFDDLKDWKEDLFNYNFTQLLTNAILSGGFAPSVREGRLPLPKALGRVLYYRGLAQEQLLRAEQFFQHALKPLQGIRVPMWKEVIRGFLTNCRAMRVDLAEIRRREQGRAERTKQTAPQRRERNGSSQLIEPDPFPGILRGDDAQDCVQRAVAFFLIKHQAPDGGFHLYRSSYAYMNPVHPLAPSPAVTQLVSLVLEPLAPLNPPLAAVCSKAVRWARQCRNGSRPLALPAPLEKAFRTASVWNHEFPSWDRRFATLSSPTPNGLFWANLLLQASRQGGRLPHLESYAKRCIQLASFKPWTCGNSTSDNGTGEQHPFACNPLLPLFLICRALGTQLLQPELQKPLHKYLLTRYEKEGSCGNITETALSLLCLLISGYEGEALIPARERLIHFQEQDGSWPPNALYEQGKFYFGSRELSTSLCTLALFLSSLGRHSRNVKRTNEDILSKDSQSTVILHPNLPKTLGNDAQRILARCGAFLPSLPIGNVYLGRWPSMPAHFLLPREQGIHAGIHLSEELEPSVRSVANRPLAVEIVLALATAARYSIHGPFRDRLERIYVAGLGLWLSEILFPHWSFPVLAGIPDLHVRWCLENEAYLWEQIRLFLHHPSRSRGSHRWLLPDQAPSSSCPIPRGACLHIGRTLFNSVQQEAKPEHIRFLLARDRRDILQAFRTRAGLQNGKPDHAL